MSEGGDKNTPSLTLKRNQLARCFYHAVLDYLNMAYAPPKPLFRLYMSRTQHEGWAPLLTRFSEAHASEPLLKIEDVVKLAKRWADDNAVGNAINDMDLEHQLYWAQVHTSKRCEWVWRQRQ